MKISWTKLLSRGPESINPRDVMIKDVPLVELAISASYVLVGGAWVIFSDELLDSVVGEGRHAGIVQTFKGVNFVTTTGFLLYLVLRRSFRNRRLAEEALRLSQERFEAVALATNDAVWDWNLDTNVLWWSDGIQKLFGYRPEDVSTKVEWWMERLHPEDKERVVRTIRHAIEHGARTWAGQYRFRRNDGTYAIVLDRGYVILSKAGKPVRVAGGMTDISERRQAEKALENSQNQLRALASRMQSAREDERASVAREIHDELGQVLTALKLNLDWLERKIGQSEGNPSINRLLDRVVATGEIVDTAISGVQRIATDLRPEILNHIGLPEALTQEAAQFQARSGIPCRLELPSSGAELLPETATAIFRIFQEALTNIARHAQASSIRASLRADGRQITLEVEDNGRGIAVEALLDARSMGLLGMRERATALGGEVAITPCTPHGTRVLLRLPLPAPSGTIP